MNRRTPMLVALYLTAAAAAAPVTAQKPAVARKPATAQRPAAGAAARTVASAPSDPLAPLRVLVGRWSGATRGKPGTGTTEREYSFRLGGHFLWQRDSSVYEGEGGRPPLVHEDVGMLSYDATAKRIVWRQFHSEGYVNEYVLQPPSPDGKTLEFVTTRIENLPGFRARKVYRVVSPDLIEEVFWLAPPGRPFEEYTVAELKRVK